MELGRALVHFDLYSQSCQLCESDKSPGYTQKDMFQMCQHDPVISEEHIRPSHKNHRNI